VSWSVFSHSLEACTDDEKRWRWVVGCFSPLSHPRPPPIHGSTPSDTAWRLVRAADDRTLLAGLSTGATLLNYCAPRGELLRLYVNDVSGNGMGAGGGFSVKAFGSVVLSGEGAFGSLYSETFPFGGPAYMGGKGSVARFVGRVDIPAGASACFARCMESRVCSDEWRPVNLLQAQRACAR
jgi:hypothetical protein